MSQFELSKTRLFEGVWEGVLTVKDKTKGPPDLGVTHLEKPLGDVLIEKTAVEGQWSIRIPVPVEMIGDGAQTFLIFDMETGEALDNFTIIAGDAATDDVRGEIALLREELDLLKRAFRRHCVETGAATG